VRMQWKWLLAPIASMLIGGHVAAKPAEGEPLQDIPMRFGHYRVDYVVNDDVTSTETRSWSATVLKPQALEWLKRTSVGYSTSVQKAEVLEAYTRKADGRRIDVPKDNYQLNISKGREAGGPAFSDYSSMSVVFPDVAVGDTVVFSYRLTQSEPIFPRHFDAGQAFSRQAAYDEVKVSIDYPGTLPVRFEGRGMQQTERESAGRRVVQWDWSNPKPVRNERKDFTVYDPDEEVGFDFSTFKDYATIARSYGERATPKAVVTDRVKQLAGEIVGDRSKPADQARALYEWVATKITYGGNCVGVGTVVPRDLDFVIDNRMGDCKDHATLLQALLAAKGIESQQALVNASSVYALPRIPRVSSVNHVINYIPSLNLYVDSTSQSTPFGSLPAQLRGKPVLLVDGKAGDPPRLPVPVNATEQRTVSKLKIDNDGSMSGTVEAHYQGDSAIGMRHWARELTPEARQDMVKEMLRSMGMNGSGSVDMDDATDLTDRFRLKLVIDKAEKFVRFPGSGAFYLTPLIGGHVVGTVVGPDTGEPIDHPGTCTSGTVIEEYAIELPRKMKLVSLPEKSKLGNSVQRYEASYQLKGNVLQVRRAFVDKTAVAVCSPDLLKEYRRLGNDVYENVKAQVLYK
jgi:transglutaminase-like putative cysteine protease